MDIREWPLDRIMQLPDCCFGRRFIVSVSFVEVTAAGRSDMSKIAFPEMSVIWGLHVRAGEVASGDASIRIALGDQVPANVGEMTELEPLFPGLGVRGAEPQTIRIGPAVSLDYPELRFPVHTAGRRLVVEFVNGTGDILSLTVAVVVSSIPTEVPNWLISAYPRSQ